jgi:hypothetical protein
MHYCSIYIPLWLASAFFPAVNSWNQSRGEAFSAKSRFIAIYTDVKMLRPYIR